MNRKLEQITEATLVPLGLVIVFVGGIYWLSSLYSLAANNRDQIDSIYRTIDGTEADRREQDRRLARIEGKIDILIEQVSKSGK